MFKIILAVIGFYILTSFFDLKIIGDSKREVFHYSYCYWAKKIPQDNIVVFRTIVHAESYGYVPCKICIPPKK